MLIYTQANLMSVISKCFEQDGSKYQRLYRTYVMHFATHFRSENNIPVLKYFVHVITMKYH